MKNIILKLLLGMGILTNCLPNNCHGFGLDSFCIPMWNYDMNCGEYYTDLSLKFYGGNISGLSKEFAYEGAGNPSPHRKISQLNWPIDSLRVLGGTIEKSIFANTIHFTLNGWGKVNSRKVTMVDRDFLGDNPHHVTDISHSPNTSLNEAYLIDGAIGYDFYRYPFCKYDMDLKLGCSLGFQYFKLGWRAHGGTFSYNNGTLNGSFPKGLVIAYQQQFYIPYFGLNFEWRWNSLDFQIFGKYSCFTYATDHDFHALRDTTFYGKYHNKEYWVAGISGSWNFWRWLSVDLSYNFERLDTSRGNVLINNKAAGTKTLARGASGISHFHNLVTVGLGALF